MKTRSIRTAAGAAAALLLSSLALAADQTTIPLNYNFNGLVHFGEAGWPDNPDGFRSISDRALIADATAGSILAAPVIGSTGLSYSVAVSPFALDIVHLGNRQVFNAYDATEDSDNVGIQPNWDTAPDHTGPQVTDVGSLNIQMHGNTQLGVLYQISNGGGAFDMTLSFTDASSVTVRLAGPDWFGANNPAAPLAGVLSQTRLNGTVWNATNSIDLGNTAPANERLNIVEAIVSTQDLINDGFGDVTGKTLESISFGNATYQPNTGRGYAIIAATIRGAEHFGPEGIGAVNPNPVVFGNTAKFTVTTTPGSGSPNHITSVLVDASAINLGNLMLNDAGIDGDAIAGDNIWSMDVTVPTDLFAGPVNSQFTITDAQARQFVGNISYSVLAPPNAVDIGTISGSMTVYSGQLDSNGVHWIRFTLANDIDRAILQFFDIDTEGSSVSGGQFANDTQIGLYTINGARVAFDDDDGTDFLSQLSFGTLISRPAPGNGVAYNGRDGATLAAGTYYLAYTGWPATFGTTNWSITGATHTSTGTVTVNFNTGVMSPVLAGPIHNPANGNDYYLLQRGFTFTEAEAHAVTLGGHLASIADADENEFVRGMVLGFDGTDRRGWIGFTDAASEGDFQWTDGSAVTFTNWAPGEPNNANNTEHYAELLGSNGLWNDLSNAGVSGGGDWAVVEVPGSGGPQFCDADWCQDGAVGVPDIFCFLSDWFALDPDARDYGGTPGVPAIFAFLSVWFSTGQGPCTP